MLSNGEYFNPELNEQKDLDLFEGDIVLSEAQRRIINSGNITSYIAKEGGHWPNGIVPYKIIGSSNSANITDFKNRKNSYMFKDFTRRQLWLIKESIKRLNHATCLKFVERRMHHKHYIRIENRLELDQNSNEWIEKGCFAKTGFDPASKHPTTNAPNNEGQNVNLETECFFLRDRNFNTVPIMKFGT